MRVYVVLIPGTLMYRGVEMGVTRWSDLSVFFFNDTATTEIYTLSLHDALPILHTLFVNNIPEGANKSLRNVQSRLFSTLWY